ncbi:MAG: PD-(D/E)XK nuclease family protein [Spirochaetales bacterium]|nr:PD-(D/E)XK nuclease family protein [Spirochaetales bacterium]
MTDPALQAVLARLDDPYARFVFPSDVAATSMLVAALEASGRRALPTRRFIGWDAFKAELFAGEHDQRPTTKAIRSLFARQLTTDNAATPFLRSIIPTAAASASTRFARTIAAALPALSSVPDGPGDQRADWRAIRDRYAEFMRDHGLYEASWLGRSASTSRDHWVLAYPDLTEDWDDYANAVAAIPGAFVILSTTLGQAPAAAARFGTLVEEVRAILQKIRDEILAGADSAGYAISVASPSSVLPILAREARVAGIALDIREGALLSESAGGRLLSDIIDLDSSSVSFDALRRLLLDSSRPWKDSVTARRLLDIGIRKHIVAPLPDGPDVWEASLGNDDEARKLYRGLRTASAKVANAGSFKALRLAYDSFRRAFLLELWSERQNDEIARSLAVLDELEEAASIAGIQGRVDAAMLWAERLADTRYLPVSKTSGIAVYRFPVAAGIQPETHFVLNLAEGAAVAAARPLSFLRADERNDAGAYDRDLSGGLIRWLAVSGKRVYLSYSESGPDGVRPPHSAVDARDPASLGVPYDRNRWLPAPNTGVELFPSQTKSAASALITVFEPESPDWAAATPSAPATLSEANTREVVAALCRDNTLSLSVTTINGYASCPFQRIHARQLRVEAVASGLSFVDNLLLGRLYHDAFQRLFMPLAGAKLTVVAPEEDDPQAMRPTVQDMERAFEAALKALGREHGLMAETLVRTRKPVLWHSFHVSATNVLAVLDGFVPVMVDDEELYAPVRGVNAELRGRPDLVCARETQNGRPEAVLVDYKKSDLPKRDDLSPDEHGELAVLQIPAYVVLVEAAGYQPNAGYYLSIEKSGVGGKGILLVFGPGEKPCIHEKQLPLLEPAIVAAAGTTADMIRSGRVFIPARRDWTRVCTRCDLRSVCRAHYSVR